MLLKCSKVILGSFKPWKEHVFDVTLWWWKSYQMWFKESSYTLLGYKSENNCSYKDSNFCYALFIFSEIAIVEYHTMLKKLR